MAQYKAQMDGLAKALTMVIICVVVIPLMAITNTAITRGIPELWIVVIAMPLLLLTAYLFRPLWYRLDRRGLTIGRPVGIKHYPIANLENAAQTDKKALGFGIRTFGAGGFFGYYGHFYYKNIGKAQLFVSDTNKMVLISLQDDKKIIISPDNTEDFLREFTLLKQR